MYLKNQGLTETQTANYCIGMMYSVTRAVLSLESYPRTKLFAWSAEKIFVRGLRNFVRGSLIGGTESMLGGRKTPLSDISNCCLEQILSHEPFT